MVTGIGLALLAWGAPVARAMLIGEASEDQMVSWASEYLKDHPNDAAAYFCLGRIHMTAWESGPGVKLRYAGRAERQLPDFPPMDSVIGPSSDSPATPQAAPRSKVSTLLDAVAAYRKAVAMDATKARYRLALAYAYEELAGAAAELPADFDWGMQEKLNDAETADFARALHEMGSDDVAARDRASGQMDKLMPRAGPLLSAYKTSDAEIRGRIAEAISRYWRTQAAELYREAYAATVADDLRAAQYDDMNDAMISAEAGERLLVLFKRDPGAERRGEAAKIAAAVKEEEGKPHMMWEF